MFQTAGGQKASCFTQRGSQNAMFSTAEIAGWLLARSEFSAVLCIVCSLGGWKTRSVGRKTYQIRELQVAHVKVPLAVEP